MSGMGACWHTVEADDPRMAASLAVWKDIDGWADTLKEDEGTFDLLRHLRVIAVIKGDVKPVLSNCDGDDMLSEVYRDDGKLLPTLIGICPTLDRAIEEKLKDQ